MDSGTLRKGAAFIGEGVEAERNADTKDEGCREVP